MLGEPADCIPDSAVDLYEVPEDKIRKIIENFIKGLDAETRVFFVRRYVYFESVASLCERFEVRKNYASVKLAQIRARAFADCVSLERIP